MHLSPTSFTVVIPAGELRGCSGQLTFVDDKIALQDDIVYTISVVVIDPPGLTALANTATLTIRDNDGKEI